MTSPQQPGERPYAVGDRIPAGELGSGDCPSVYRGGAGVIAPCALEGGHDGQHVATGYDNTVVCVWSGDSS
jgi:hypothetical protein